VKFTFTPTGRSHLSPLPALAIALAELLLEMGLSTTAHILAGTLRSIAAHGQDSTTSPAGPRLEGIDSDQFAPPRPTGTLSKQEPGQYKQHQDSLPI
jgi:hypothetical protein